MSVAPAVVVIKPDTSRFEHSITEMRRSMRRFAISLYLTCQRQDRRDLAYGIGIRLRGETA